MCARRVLLSCDGAPQRWPSALLLLARGSRWVISCIILEAVTDCVKREGGLQVRGTLHRFTAELPEVFARTGMVEPSSRLLSPSVRTTSAHGRRPPSSLPQSLDSQFRAQLRRVRLTACARRSTPAHTHTNPVLAVPGGLFVLAVAYEASPPHADVVTSRVSGSSHAHRGGLPVDVDPHCSLDCCPCAVDCPIPVACRCLCRPWASSLMTRSCRWTRGPSAWCDAV